MAGEFCRRKQDSDKFRGTGTGNSNLLSGRFTLACEQWEH